MDGGSMAVGVLVIAASPKGTRNNEAAIMDDRKNYAFR